MEQAAWQKRIDDYIAAENAKIGTVLPVHRIYCQDGSDRSGGGIYNETVTVDTIGRFARAIGDSNPLYSNPAYAAKSLYHGIVAPPLIEACVVSTFVGGAFPRLRGMTVFDAGTKWERFLPIRPDDHFSVKNHYLGIKELSKNPKEARLLLRSHALNLTNQNGEKAAVVTARSIIKCLSPEAQKTKQKPAHHNKAEARPHYTKEVLEKIANNLAAQFDGVFRQGVVPRYWEDVKVGDELPETIVGPYDEADSRSIMAAIGAANAFATKWGSLHGRNHQIVDPETGAPRDPVDRHMSDLIARIQGSKRAIAPGIHNQTLLSRTVSDWMGDAGFLKVLDCQCRRSMYFGDVSYQTGVVTKKYIKNDENLVELQLKAARQDGVVHTTATAVVRLPSKQAER